ncbi:MAG: hypothetical protein JWP02_2132 [Acidimicrobiales bacterium]|nr:hypothetical protein [Acidimicrobiales bacterium]
MVMVFVAGTLAALSTVHLTGNTPGDFRSPFDPSHAGVAEAIIGAALAGGGIAVLRAANQARMVALAATAFAIVGFLVGLNFTIRGGGTPDVVYHAVMLPVLVATLVLLARSGEGERPSA